MSCGSVASAMVWSPYRSARKLQQTQNVNPQDSHEMPIPASNIEDYRPRFDGPPQWQRDHSNKQRQDATQQVHAMRSRQQIKEGAAGVGGDIEAPCSKFAPSGPLPGEKDEAKHDCEREPGSVPPAIRCRAEIAERGLRHSSLARDLPSRQFHGSTADQQHQSVDEQKSR